MKKFMVVGSIDMGRLRSRWIALVCPSGSVEYSALLLPACGEKVGMRGLMRFG
jgi:hypothetical protein